MIWEFPTTQWKTVDVVVEPNYTRRDTVVTRHPWLRIIWGPTQKTICVGRYRRINFTNEPSAVEHLDAVTKAEQEEP
jgi:hypothetical protein